MRECCWDGTVIRVLHLCWQRVRGAACSHVGTQPGRYRRAETCGWPSSMQVVLALLPAAAPRSNCKLLGSLRQAVGLPRWPVAVNINQSAQRDGTE